jgi:hemerythrin-like domain-containing protein
MKHVYLIPSLCESSVLMLTEEHFNKEETAVFPMAEELMGAELLEVHNS